jgi:PAS domain-containing protein
MTITYMNAAFSYNTPDTELIRASRAELVRKLSTRKDIYLPPLKEQLDALDELLYRVDDKARELLTATPVALRIDEARDMLRRMQSAAGLTPSALAESKAQAFQAELDMILDSALQDIETQATLFNQRLDDLSGWTLSDVTSFIADHEHQITALQSTLPGFEAQLDELKANKQRIDAALQVYDDKTVLDRWTPILEDLLKVRDASLPLATLKAGVAGAVNILRIASESVRYDNLVEAREHAQALLKDVRTQMGSIEEQLGTLSARNRQLRKLEGIEGVMQRYQRQVRAVADALTTFLALRERQTDEPADEFARTYLIQAQALSAWLQDLRKNWR